MPQPTLSTRKPPKLKRSKASGAIVKDASARKNAAFNDSTETESSVKAAGGPVMASSNIADTQQGGQGTESVVALRVSQFESNIVDVNSASLVEKFKKNINENIKVHNKLVKDLSVFSSKTLITRRDIVSLSDIFSVYTELNDIEIKIVRDFKNFLKSIALSEEEAENSSVYIKPSTIYSNLELSAKVISSAKEKFRKIKAEYSESPQVITSLDFVEIDLKRVLMLLYLKVHLAMLVV